MLKNAYFVSINEFNALVNRHTTDQELFNVIRRASFLADSRDNEHHTIRAQQANPGDGRGIGCPSF